MKFQYLAVIFVIIILPIAMVLSFYTQAQMEIVNTQTSYTSKLTDATYDAVKAFQINTTNSYYSSVSDSKIRDIEAAVNTFYNSLTASLDLSKEDLEPYVPAIVFTLYDGYYIYGKMYNVYTDTEINNSGELTSMTIDTELADANNYEYGLKPFVYYSCRYYKDSNNDFVVNFTLDNFISIYGTVNGEYVTKSGYLINISDITIDGTRVIYKGAEIEETEILTEYLKFSDGESNGVSNGEYTYVVYNNQKIYKSGTTYFWYDQGVAHTVSDQAIKNAVDKGTTSAVDYYTDAYEFSKWVNDNIGNITQDNIQYADGSSLDYDSGDAKIFDTENQDPEDPASTFNQHRSSVIKNTIVTNLITAINSYNSNASSYEYALPQLLEEDWEKVVNNVCVISFMQGIPIGGKYFNNYAVIPNDTNNEFVDTDSIYILTADGQYHLPNCPDLVEDKDYQATIVGGYAITSFERQTMDDTYYYKHVQNENVSSSYTACYHCIVAASGKYDLTNDILLNSNNKIGSYDITALRNAYLTIFAREKYNLYKTNNETNDTVTVTNPTTPEDGGTTDDGDTPDDGGITEEEAVAEYNSTYYASIQDAIDAVETSGTITMLKSTTESPEIPANKTIELKLNGKTVTGSITNKGTLTLTGNGNIVGSSGVRPVISSGTFTLNSGVTISSSSLGVNSTGTMIMNGGTIDITSGTTALNIFGSGATFKMTRRNYNKCCDRISCIRWGDCNNKRWGNYKYK